MNVLDLFSGIGGFSLGLERAGMRTVAFCEIEPFCRAVLKKNWPHVPCYPDIRELTVELLRTDGISVDVICGGFPCQDISIAGKGIGIDGARSGLWSEYARIIGELRPRYVIVENVAALLVRGIDRVLGNLAALGYDAEWHCIPASAVGAPHRRDRLWVVANADEGGTLVQRRYRNSDNEKWNKEEKIQERQNIVSWAIGASDDVTDTKCEGLEGSAGGGCARTRWAPGIIAGINQGIRGQWFTEPDVGRVAYGISARVDRLQSLGNAVVPQIPEIIGRAIMQLDESANG